jgi:O-antigen ligase
MNDGFARIRRQPFYLLCYLYGFLIPFDFYLSTELHVTIVHLVQALLFVAFWIRVVAGRGRMGIRAFQELSVLFGTLWILWCAASALWAIDPPTTTRGLLRQILAFGAFLCILSLPEDGDVVASLASALCAGTALMTGYALWQYARQDYGPLYDWFSPYYSELFVARGGLALVGTYANPNILAACGMLVLPLLWWRRNTSSGRVRIFWGLVYLALIVVLLKTYSKWCWALLLVVLIALALSRASWLARCLTAAAAASAMVVGVIMRSQIADALSRALPDARESSIAPRVELWKAAWKVWETRPLAGFGVDGFAAATIDLRTDPQLVGLIHAHNWFAQTAVDLGVIGLILWLLWFGSLWTLSLHLARRSARLRNVLPIALCISLATVPLVGLFDDHGQSNQYVNVQWYVAALAVASIRLPGRDARMRGHR